MHGRRETPTTERDVVHFTCLISICLFLFADIQEFYEITLLDDTKSIHQKTVETLSMATKWEKQPPIVGATQLQVSEG